MIVLDDIAALVCAPDIPIREVLARINAAHPHLFQVVVDADHHVLGTVTDGDVRRAMLRGVGLDDPVRHCMHARPIAGRLDEPDANLRKLRTAIFLPVLDEGGALRHVLIAEAAAGGPRRAVIMAGGYGARLGARTRQTPKPLLPVGEQPLLGRIMEQLEAAGIRDIHIAIHYLGEQIERFVAARDNRAEIGFIRESEPLGTAGALAQLPAGGREPVLVVNGDLFTRIDFQALDAFHHGHGLDGSIAVARFDVEIPYGVVTHDDNGLFAGIEEKPTRRQFVAAGVYYLAPEFLALVPAGARMEMPELLNAGREIGLRIGLFPVHESWLDIGRPADFDIADDLFRQEQVREGSVP